MTYPWLIEAYDQFRSGLRSGQLAHATLLAGPEQLGKRGLAKEMAGMLLCTESSAEACGECRSCQSVIHGAHPDFRNVTFEINPKTDNLRTEIVVQQIRALIASLQLTNSLSARKVAIVQPAEAMNHAAANALLKTLEEPPGDAFLMIVSHKPSRLPATIRSRCQRLDVRLPASQSAVAWLLQNAETTQTEAALALKASAGSPLKAKSLIEAGEVEHFAAVDRILKQVRHSENPMTPPWDKLLSLDPPTMWNWFSLLAADHLRHLMQSTADPSNDVLLRAKQLARLQLMADHNQRLVPTQVRKDLLLRDWLLQWISG